MLSAFGFVWCSTRPSWGQLWAPSILVLSAFGFTVVTSKSWSLSNLESCEYCVGSVWVIHISWHPFPCRDDMGCILAALGLCSLLTPLIRFFKLFVRMLWHKAFKYLYLFITTYCKATKAIILLLLALAFLLVSPVKKKFQLVRVEHLPCGLPCSLTPCSRY